MEIFFWSRFKIKSLNKTLNTIYCVMYLCIHGTYWKITHALQSLATRNRFSPELLWFIPYCKHVKWLTLLLDFSEHKHMYVIWSVYITLYICLKNWVEWKNLFMASGAGYMYDRPLHLMQSYWCGVPEIDWPITSTSFLIRWSLDGRSLRWWRISWFRPSYH